MENLQQIVVQITTSEEKRAIAQFGTGMIPEDQFFIKYDELTEEEKLVWDNFIEMIKNKQS